GAPDRGLYLTTRVARNAGVGAAHHSSSSPTHTGGSMSHGGPKSHGGPQPDTRMSRRTVLTALGALGAAAALPPTAAALPPTAAQPGRRAPAVHSGGRRVAILGGGMAGLAAAHELIERGFEVTVFEPTALGGKARSIPSPGTAAGGRLDLPGEHGF